MKKVLAILLILAFAPINYLLGQTFENILIVRPRVPRIFALNVPDQSIAQGAKDTLNLLNYTTGDKTGIEYSLIGSPNRIKLWELPAHATGDVIRPYSVFGNMVSAGQTARTIGIGMRKDAVYSFKIPEGYKYFRGFVGHDEEADKDTNGFAIYADNVKIAEGHGLRAWEDPKYIDVDISGHDSLKFYVWDANSYGDDHISVLDGFVDKETKWDARLELEVSGTKLNINAKETLPPGDYYVPIVATNAKAEADTDTIHFTISPPTYLSQTVNIPNSGADYIFVPVVVKVPHLNGMRSDFRDVEFFNKTTGDTLWSDIFRTFGTDSAYFVVRIDTLPAGGKDIEYRYAFSNGHKNKWNNDLYIANFYDPGHGMPSHLMPMYRDTTTEVDRFTPGNGGNERGYIVVDSTGKYYFFASATEDYDQSKTDGCQIYLYTSTDSGKTWHLEHNGNPLWTGHWGEDVYIFKNPYASVTQWIALVEDESRATASSKTQIIAFIADSLMQPTWTFVDTVLNPDDPDAGYWENKENGTPGVLTFRNDTLWMFYEGIGQYDGHPHEGTLNYAFATDSASIFHPTRYSGNPIQGSPWNSDTDYKTHNVGATVFDWVLFDGQQYHGFSHQQTPYKTPGNHNLYVMAHWLSGDLFHWTLDPDTTVLLAHRVFTWIINSDVNYYDVKDPYNYNVDFNTDKRWLYDLKYHKYPQVRRWGGRIYNVEKMTGDTTVFDDWFYRPVPYNGELLDGMYVRWRNRDECYRASNYLRPLDNGYTWDIGIIYRSGDSGVLSLGDWSNRWAELATTNANDKWKLIVQDDSGNGHDVVFPATSGDIVDTYYQIHVEATFGGEAKVWYKKYSDATWTYAGSTGANTVSTNRPTYVKIGQWWPGAKFSFECDIMYIMVNELHSGAPMTFKDVVR